MKLLNYRKQEVTSMRFNQKEKNEDFDIIIETNTLLKKLILLKQHRCQLKIFKRLKGLMMVLID